LPPAAKNPPCSAPFARGSEVAAKYAGQADAAAMLADKVQKGGVGAWGKVPMPPNPQVNAADAKALVDWILTLK